MPKFDHPLPDPAHADFDTALTSALSAMPVAKLHLDRAMRSGSIVIDDPTQWMLLERRIEADRILVKAGVFFNSQIAGCSCADDPSPADINHEFSEVLIEIESDRTRFSLSYT